MLLKKMDNVKIVFDILSDDQELPSGYKKAIGHIIVGVQMTLERKAWWVKDDHKTLQPDWSRYAGVVLREIICITLTYTALNGLSVCGCDIQNAYLQEPASEKNYLIRGPDFGLKIQGKRAIIVHVLYGLVNKFL